MLAYGHCKGYGQMMSLKGFQTCKTGSIQSLNVLRDKTDKLDDKNIAKEFTERNK